MIEHNVNKNPRRKNIRLRGYDYTQSGSYFVTICTKNREYIFGNIVDSEMEVSSSGKIVESCWKEIPKHFQNTRTDVFQVMPNHVHGIIEIYSDTKKYLHPNTRRDTACRVPTDVTKFGEPKSGSLSTIVRSFKSAVTKLSHEHGLNTNATIWQSRFYDHIIRNDAEYFFIERYIRMNPIFWYLDSDNPKAHAISVDNLRSFLRTKHNFDENDIEKIVDYENGYRMWREN